MLPTSAGEPPLWTPQRLLAGRRQTIDDAADDLRAAVDERLRARRERLRAASRKLETCNPTVRLSRRRERLALVAYRLTTGGAAAVVHHRRRLSDLAARIEPAVSAATARRRTKLELIGAQLDGRNPTRILQRGYAIVSLDGVPLRDAATVVRGALITARLARGTLDARVESTSGDGGE